MTPVEHDASLPSRVFDAASLERNYAFLDECPENLLKDVIVLPYGDLRERVRGVRVWRNALLEGQLPPVGVWPPERIAAPARQALDRMGIAKFCKGQEKLVDEILRDILQSFIVQGDILRADVARRLRELEKLERERAKEEYERRVRRTPEDLSEPPPERLHEDLRVRLRAQAEREMLALTPEADAGLIEIWEDRAQLWARISDVFDDLGHMLGRGWDLTSGILQHVGWREVLRLRELVERLPQLREIVQSLGRLHASDKEESVAERVFLPTRRLEEERREAWTPRIPADTRGVERGDSVARMLPSEAAMLGHPKLRLLWHARRAERALLTYRVEGVEYERALVERESSGKVENRRRALERGPILAVVDMSGSMHGLPECVAKALVLEALRTAHAEKRRCRLHAFSGPGQTIEHELDLSPEGIGGLLDFLALSFGGGSDPTAATDRVLQQLRDGGWKKADVLFVSDGEWPDPPSSHTREARKAREAGTRFHGIQIGNRGRTGLHALCEPVHVFTDWADVIGDRRG